MLHLYWHTRFVYRVLCKKKSDGKRERGKVYDRKGRIDTGGVRIGDKKTEGKAVQTYEDKGMLYIARGYGKKATTGYSVKVKKCEETENTIYFHTNLIGPSKQEEIVKKANNPHIVIALPVSDKTVIFE